MPAKPRLRLVSVYSTPQSAKILYELLAERNSRINISHRAMPTPAQHRAFIRSKPYRGWFLLKSTLNNFVGSVYLSKGNEIGIFIFKKHRALGYGKAALKIIQSRFSPKRFLANINPANKESINFFKKAGFKHIQNTYELRKK